MADWEHFHHQADIGVRGRGDSLEAAFVQAAIGLTAVITDPSGVAGVIPVSIHCEAPDDQLLFVDWLNALIYQMAVRKMLFSRFQVGISHGTLEATAWGEAIEIARHQPAVEIKGATYTELRVEQSDRGDWLAQCVVDV